MISTYGVHLFSNDEYKSSREGFATIEVPARGLIMSVAESCLRELRQ